MKEGNNFLNLEEQGWKKTNATIKKPTQQGYLCAVKVVKQKEPTLNEILITREFLGMF